jgi:hypothetical protein
MYDFIERFESFLREQTRSPLYLPVRDEFSGVECDPVRPDSARRRIGMARLRNAGKVELLETAAIVAAGQGQGREDRSYEKKNTMSQVELPNTRQA